MRQGTLTVCDHNWLEHLKFGTGMVDMLVCSICGASRKPDPDPPVIEMPGVTTREQAERIARRAFPAPAAEDAEPVLSEATQKLLAEAMDAVARDIQETLLERLLKGGTI